MKPIKRISCIITTVIAVLVFNFGCILKIENAFAEQLEYVHQLSACGPDRIYIYDFDGKHIVKVDGVISYALGDFERIGKNLQRLPGQYVTVYPYKVEYESHSINAESSVKTDTDIIFDLEKNNEETIIIPLRESYKDVKDGKTLEHNGILRVSVEAKCYYSDMSIGYDQCEYNMLSYEIPVIINKGYKFYYSSVTLSNHEKTKLSITNHPGTIGMSTSSYTILRKYDDELGYATIDEFISAGESGTIAKWSSDNTSIATVDEFGNVSAVEDGKTVITADIYKITGQNKYNSETEGYYSLSYLGSLQCEVVVDLSRIDKGDINNDGEINISDAVLLQKYLLGAQQFTKEQYEAADINQDGSTDVFDMVFMRKLLISQE